MKERYLEVTYRQGKPIAGYLHLPRPNGVKSARTEEVAPGLLVDFSADGAPIGLEVTCADEGHARGHQRRPDRVGAGTCHT